MKRITIALFAMLLSLPLAAMTRDEYEDAHDEINAQWVEDRAACQELGDKAEIKACLREAKIEWRSAMHELRRAYNGR